MINNVLKELKRKNKRYVKWQEHVMEISKKKKKLIL